ncbi:MAG: 30S ribosomal protein S8 [Candidatus Calescibacterium sp.]|nr:30S ribosomal protein S8 [Candidatus Calescibacterium sp.]MCX7972714.1 30S ribosomal protein S8 [bacterium]MDW8195518.1 30S ribosomal protein S8 [Candidatus Calescibacterium sp.]
MLTDPIADMFARIKNAINRKHETVKIPGSKIKKSILELLKKEGYIEDYSIEPLNDYSYNFVVKLKYYKGKSVINDLKRVSKPGRRIYTPYKEIPLILSGLGLTIVSTSKGIMSHREAMKNKLGGEIIGFVY